LSVIGCRFFVVGFRVIALLKTDNRQRGAVALQSALGSPLSGFRVLASLTTDNRKPTTRRAAPQSYGTGQTPCSICQANDTAISTMKAA
jgi:hypothetical protein